LSWNSSVVSPEVAEACAQSCRLRPRVQGPRRLPAVGVGHNPRRRFRSCQAGKSKPRGPRRIAVLPQADGQQAGALRVLRALAVRPTTDPKEKLARPYQVRRRVTRGAPAAGFWRVLGAPVVSHSGLHSSSHHRFQFKVLR
jgi:hypothetical protein